MSNAKKVYILHGWAYSTEKWQPFLIELKKHGITAEMLKIPGLSAPLNSVWELNDYVEWLKKIIDKEKEKVVLLGHSNGGRILIAFAAKYPEKIKQLILIDSAGIYHNELPIRFKRNIFKTLAKIGKKLNNSERIRNLLYKIAREGDYRKAEPIVRKTMTNLIKVDLRQILSQIPIPVVIIWGAEDKITPLKDGQLMQRKLTKASLHIIPHARHAPQFSHPEKVAKIVDEFLRKVS